MSRSAERIQQVINRLKSQFEGTPYYLKVKDRPESPYAWNFSEVPETKDDLLLSVIIPARNEWPNCTHTVHSILNCWEADGFDYYDIEIIVVDNASSERHSNDEKFFTHPVDQGTSSYLEARGCFYSGIVKTRHYPLAGNHTARNRGAEIARGKFLFFSDAHMSYRPGFFRHMLRACEESGGIVHGAIAWMGTYPPMPPSIGMQYTLKLGEEFKGTWAPYVTTMDNWSYIASQGHCSVMVRRDQFLRFGGYQEYHRTYGGGEIYMDLKWWLLGSTVAVEPRAVGYHLKSFRGYSWHHDDYIHNVLNITYALGADDWRERCYINWLRTGRKEVLDKMMAEGEKEMVRDRTFIENRRVKTIGDLLVEIPWNKMNQEKFGRASGSILVYHDTWLDLLKLAPRAWEYYEKEAKYQKQLEEFINKHLDQYVYKRKR